MSEKEKNDDDFYEALEQGVRDVLKDNKATRAEKMEAIGLGTKLMQVKHKIPGDKKEEEDFFKK